MNSTQYFLVQERLSLAKRILEQGEQLRDPSLIQDKNDGWTHLYIHHEALVNYLLLTCFDILGQSNEWLPFNSWLQADRTKCEREEAAALISHSATPVEIAQEMYAAYQSNYGVKTSFYRFIDEVLDEKARERLLFSVKIEQKLKNGDLIVIKDPLRKKAFLYESRNLFTHYLLPTGSPARGVWTENLIIKDGKLLWGYSHVRTKNNNSYSVRKWPFELFEIISNTIEQPIEIYDFNVECSVWVTLEPSAGVVINSINFLDLRDLNTLIDFARKNCEPQ